MSNNFSGDSDCVTLWNFDVDLLLVDSKGTSTLSQVGGSGTVTVDTSNKKQGTASGEWKSGENDELRIADTDLDNNHPLKAGNPGTFSLCFFLYKPDDNDKAVLNKGLTPTTRCLRINAFTSVRFSIGHTGGNSWEDIAGGGDWSGNTPRWFHVGLTFDNSSKAYRLRVWDMTADALFDETTGTATNNINVEGGGDGRMSLGRDDGSTAGNWEGNLDEMVWFKDILTADEIDAIRAGTYNEGVAGNALFMGSNF